MTAVDRMPLLSGSRTTMQQQAITRLQTVACAHMQNSGTIDDVPSAALPLASAQLLSAASRGSFPARKLPSGLDILRTIREETSTLDDGSASRIVDAGAGASGGRIADAGAASSSGRTADGRALVTGSRAVHAGASASSGRIADGSTPATGSRAAHSGAAASSGRATDSHAASSSRMVNVIAAARSTGTEARVASGVVHPAAAGEHDEDAADDFLNLPMAPLAASVRFAAAAAWLLRLLNLSCIEGI